MRRIAMIIAGAAVATLVFGGSPALASVPQHQVTLTGAAERPDPGDHNGRGQFTWSVDGNRVCYLLSVTKFGTALQAHIHRGGKNVAGPVLVTLVPPKPASAGCATVSAALAHNLRVHPRRFYVNVHNAKFPAGGLRAQLTK
jgi:hypothetical protein